MKVFSIGAITRLPRFSWLMWLLVLLLGPLALSSSKATSEVSQADRELAEQVFRRLMNSVSPPQGVPWPPKLEIVDKAEINAFAVLRSDENGRKYAVVVCYSGLVRQVVEGNADRMALVFGHEMAHHILGHTSTSAGDTQFLQATFSRQQEIAADRKGMEIALRANYSYRGALSTAHRFIDLGLNYSSFEGLGHDHPSWGDRIALLDKEQTALWRSMSSFDNGVYFLLVQNYALAERAFRQVTKDFPSSYEAWANLGYALLMQYADSLDTEDLRHFDVGQIVAGGFYRRPKSLQSRVRGINEEMWWDAVGALREAIRLKPDLSLAKANLGIAYLFRPAGKDPGKATEYFEEANQLANVDASLDPLSRLTEEINLAVAYSAQGQNEKALAALGKVEASLKRDQTAALPGTNTLADALSYNRALLLARSPDAQQHRLAVAELENYLRRAASSVAWWPLAFQRYTELCREFAITGKTQSALLSETGARLRPVIGLSISKTAIAIGENLGDVQARLGPANASSPVVRGTNLVQLSYPTFGIRLIGTDELLAIILSGDTAPSVPIRQLGLGAKSAELRVGMSSTDLDRVLGDADYDFRQLVDPNVNYRFYADLGIAILTASGKVTEVVISQIPKELTLR